MTPKTVTKLLLALWLSWLTVASAAAQDARISDLTYVDQDYMAQQRSLIQDLAVSRLGRQFSGDRDRDLDLLQTILDQQLVKPDQVRELQAMGVIMGDLLAAQLDMHWVIYEDREGRSRALRYGETDNYLFPITMIARRREVGNLKPVAEIYQKAVDIIVSATPKLPFQ